MTILLVLATLMRLLGAADLPHWDWGATVLPVRAGVPALSDWKGETSLLIYFSPECSHCIDAWPKVVELFRRSKAVGLHVGGIATYATTRLEVTMFLEALGEDVPVWFDSTRAVAKPYAIKTVPQAILIGADGSTQLFDELTPERMQQVEGIARRSARAFQ